MFVVSYHKAVLEFLETRDSKARSLVENKLLEFPHIRYDVRLWLVAIRLLDKHKSKYVAEARQIYTEKFKGNAKTDTLENFYQNPSYVKWLRIDTYLTTIAMSALFFLVALVLVSLAESILDFSQIIDIPDLAPAFVATYLVSMLVLTSPVIVYRARKRLQAYNTDKRTLYSRF